MFLVVIPVVVVTVIIVVPMTLIVFPAVVIVVIVRMSPICACVGRPAPYSGDPHISAAVPVPISIDPGITRTRHGRPHLIAQRGRSSAYIYAYSGEGLSRECRSQDRGCNPFRFHMFSPYYHLSYNANPTAGERFRPFFGGSGSLAGNPKR
jgi:hypothetical protein